MLLGSWRAAVLVLSLTLSFSLDHSVAQGQSCHDSSLLLHRAYAFRASLGSSFASYRNHYGKGEYQGLHAALAYSHPWVFAELAAPTYRLVRDGETHYGMGDVSLDVRVALRRSANDPLVLGLGLAASAPSGDADLGFGMGHVMLMPGAWLLFEQNDLLLLMQLSYGRVVGDSGEHAGHGHGSSGSLVQPMNASEVEHTLGLAYRLHPQLRALARLMGAVPIAAPGGAAREVLALSLVGVLAERFDVGAQVELPLIGDPFRLRTLLSLGASW